MLTKEQSILHFDFHTYTLQPDRLVRTTHGHYLPLAEKMLRIYFAQIGEPRKAVHRQIHELLQAVEDCPTRRIAAFCKLLDDASEYQKDRSGVAARLRARVFSLAAARHPLVQSSDQLFDHDEAVVKTEIAEEVGMTWPEIEAALFADVIEFHRLSAGPTALDAAGLLRRYNVAQTQAALYGAVSMTVRARRDFKTILRYAKLARLMHSIDRRGDEYVFHLNGPASILRHTQRYGVAFAKFLPGLLAAHDWRMQAVVLGPGKRRFALRLGSRSGLHGEMTASDFDSQLESSFADAWQRCDTHGWSLRREATVLHQGQTVFTPDFTLTHPSCGEVLLEIVGFWTPEYLREKASRLERFRKHAPIILAISETASEAIPDLGLPRVTYKTKLRPQPILELLERLFPPA